MKEIYEVYVGDGNYAEGVSEAVFESVEDAEAFANYHALLDGHSYTVCKRNVHPAGSGSKWSSKIFGKVIRFVGEYNSNELDQEMLYIYNTEVVDKDIESPLVDIDQDNCMFGCYLFDISYKIGEEKTFDDIKATLIKLIKGSIS